MEEGKAGSLERKIRRFKRILTETFEEPYGSSLYMVKYYLLEQKVEVLQRFGMI